MTIGSKRPANTNGYRLFPDELEQYPEVFFHGTDRRFFQSIVDDGFRFPPPDKAQSVSFARNSALGLVSTPRTCKAAVEHGWSRDQTMASSTWGHWLTPADTE
jgi:hypothetical protein